MNYLKTGLTAFLAGTSISLGIYFGIYILPDSWFGVLPYLLATLIGLGPFMLSVVAPQDAKDRGIFHWLGSAAFILAPVAVLILYSGTGYLSFISQEPGVVSFILRFLIGAIIVAVPLLGLTVARSGTLLTKATSPQTNIPESAFALACLALGLYIHQTAVIELPITIVFAVQAAAAILIPIIPGKPTPQEALPEQPARKPHGKKKGKQLPPDLPKVEEAVKGLMSIGVLYLALFVFSELLRRNVDHISVFGIVVPLVFASVGLGLFLGKRYSHLLPAQRIAVPSIIYALSLAIGIWRLNATLFDEMYIAYYAGNISTISVAEFTLWLLLLPTVATGFFTASRRWESFSYGHPGLFYTAILLVAGLGYMVTYAIVPLEAAAIVTAGLISVGGAIGIHYSPTVPKKFRLPISFLPIVVTAIIWIVTPPLGYGDFFNPDSFRVVQEIRTPAGSHTLIESRDDDNTFHSFVWNETDIQTQSSNAVIPDLRRFAHLPALLHKEPKEVLSLGIGSGIELATFALYKEVEKLTCVEPDYGSILLLDTLRKISKEMEQLDTLELVSARWEAYLASSDARFDVIISPEPLAIAYPGSRIFQPELYQLASGRLNEDGLFIQWIPLSRVNIETARRIAASMRPSFKHMELWTGHLNVYNGMLAIIASNSPLNTAQLNKDRFAQFSEDPRVSFELVRSGIPTVDYLAAEYGMIAKSLDSWIGDAKPFEPFEFNGIVEPENKDEEPSQAFLQTLEDRTLSPRLIEARSDSSADILRNLFDTRTRIMAIKTRYTLLGDTSEVRTLIDIIERQPYNLEAKEALADAFIQRGAQMVAQGNYGGAKPLLLQATSLIPLNTYVLRLLLISALSTGDQETAETCMNGIKRINPDHAGFRDNQATLVARGGLVEEALLIYESAISLDPYNENFYYNMASLQLRVNRAWEAARILDNGISKAYYPAKLYVLRAQVYAQGRRSDLAMENYEEFLRIAKPNDPMIPEVMVAIRQLKEK